jgi:hypothetical protein
MMSEALKDWLPITVRNRVALGFAFAALVMFVTWNILPLRNSIIGYPTASFFLWPKAFSLNNYIHLLKSTSTASFLELAAYLTLLLNGLIVLVIIPFWRVFHVSGYIRVPLAVVNFTGSLINFRYAFFNYPKKADYSIDWSNPWFIVVILIGLSMLTLSVTLFLFKNEQGLRNDLEVKKSIAGGDSR